MSDVNNENSNANATNDAGGQVEQPNVENTTPQATPEEMDFSDERIESDVNNFLQEINSGGEESETPQPTETIKETPPAEPPKDTITISVPEKKVDASLETLATERREFEQQKKEFQGKIDKAESMNEKLELLKDNPDVLFDIIKDTGLTMDQVVDAMVDGKKPGEVQNKLAPEVEQELKELKEWKAEQEKELEARKQIETVEAYKTDITNQINEAKNPAGEKLYSKITERNVHDQVFELIGTHYNTFQAPIDEGTAANIVEAVHSAAESSYPLIDATDSHKDVVNVMIAYTAKHGEALSVKDACAHVEQQLDNVYGKNTKLINALAKKAGLNQEPGKPQEQQVQRNAPPVITKDLETGPTSLVENDDPFNDEAILDEAMKFVNGLNQS